MRQVRGWGVSSRPVSAVRGLVAGADQEGAAGTQEQNVAAARTQIWNWS
jgi:hypothetical protein